MSTIKFYPSNNTEVLRLSKDGITANPDIPVDDAAKLILSAIDSNIKLMVNKAVASEREACAKVCEAYTDNDGGKFIDHEGHGYEIADIIRSRGETK